MTPSQHAFELVSIFFAGLLAGEEFVMRFGIRGPLATLDTSSHIRLRQALIRRLRVLVPCLFALTVVPVVASVAMDGDHRLGLRLAALALLATWALLTAFGTVPINAAAFEWDPVAPPSDWGMQIERWERLNTLRTAAALGAFVALLLSVA